MTTQATRSEPDTRRWNRREFAQMADLGWFHGQRAELIEGEIMVLSPQNFPHYSAVDRVCEVLKVAFGPGFWVRQQGPMGFGAFSEPEPDVSVVAGQREDYHEHPATAVLLVEVSDTTLSYDRHRKASLYATVGIQEYWIVNLVNQQLEVHRQPAADPASTFGSSYQSVAVLWQGDTASLLALPGVGIRVADLLG